MTITHLTTKEKIRDRLLRLVLPGSPIARSILEREFCLHNRQAAADEISLLLSEGIFHETGLGHRGSPKMIQRGSFPCDRKCPFCHQDLPFKEPRV